MTLYCFTKKMVFAKIMKKNSFRSFLALSTGLVISFLALTAMFNIFHWPGGRLYLLIATGLVACLSCCYIVYVCMFGILKSLCEEGNIDAKHLRNIEIAALILLIIIAIGIFMKGMHWHAVGPILIIALMAFIILSIIAACIGSHFFAIKTRHLQGKIHVKRKSQVES